MIQIHQELCIEQGDAEAQSITLWMVSYGDKLSAREMDQTQHFIESLRCWCLAQGWQLESGDDPYQEQSLRIFDGGFSSPDDEGWDGIEEKWADGGGD